MKIVTFSQTGCKWLVFTAFIMSGDKALNNISCDYEVKLEEDTDYATSFQNARQALSVISWSQRCVGYQGIAFDHYSLHWVFLSFSKRQKGINVLHG